MASTCVDSSQSHRAGYASSFIAGGDAPLLSNQMFYDAITPLSQEKDIMALLFSQKQSLHWDEFRTASAKLFRARDEDLEKIRPILASENLQVSACQFAKLLRWFTPLVPETSPEQFILNGKLSSPSSPAFMWRISDIAKLMSQPWFHGFELDSHHVLQQCAPGTFLIRFGSQPPHFALALKDQSINTVVEWRVLAQRGRVRLADTDAFSDLYHLVDAYSMNTPQGASCSLQVPCPRSQHT